MTGQQWHPAATVAGLHTGQLWTHAVCWGWLPSIDQMLPGAHAVSVADPGKALRVAVEARTAGWEVRDTIVIVTADGPLLAPLLRKPFRGTLADNAAEHGVGGLNIDGCRVIPDGGVPDGADAGVYGRFPPDVLFVHHRECVRGGWRSVLSNSHHPARRGADGLTVAGHKGQTGLVERKPGAERVAVFDCAPGCPVAELDKQSGVLKSGANPTRRVSDSKSVSMAGVVRARDQEPVRRGAEEGGASRFYPTFQSLDEVRAWLGVLLTPPA